VPRFLEAIERDAFLDLPGLVFTRNFVRQYALALKLDPDPLLAELPKEDESTVRLPDPPARPSSSYQRDRAVHAIMSYSAWLLLAGGAGVVAYVHFNHSPQTSATADAVAQTNAVVAPRAPEARRAASGSPTASPAPPSATPVVQVSLTAHEAAWVQVSTDGKTTFTGILKSNETKEISAAEQVKILTGNAGALTISLNGKTLESIGPLGQVRAVKLTAEGPQLLSRDPPSAPDPL
jgi:cytoskeleton protein RodZ